MNKLMFIRHDNVEVRIGKSPRKFKPAMLKMNEPVLVIHDRPITDTTLYIQVLTRRGIGWIDGIDLSGVEQPI